MHTVDDPDTGMNHIRMCCWSALLFTPSPEAVAEAETREGITLNEAKEIHS